MGLFRKFSLRESMNLQFRGEFSNALNLVNLNGPTTTQNSPLFGQIRSPAQMRQVQVGLRLTF